MIYGYPDVGRHGLGHSLLAWGRCQLWCRDRSAQPLAPRWLRLRLGPYLRRERDKRNYFLLFRSGNAIGGLRKAWILARTRKVEEGDAANLDPARPAIVVFRSIPDNDVRRDFAALRGEGAWLRDQLEAMTLPRHLPGGPAYPHVAIHVRMGDFSVSDPDRARSGQQNVRTGIDWFTGALEALRASLGESIPAIVYSDGREEELSPLLRLPSVVRAPPRSAVTDLLSIARADALIGSGSGFSIWGSLLGDVPRLSAPGQQLTRVLALEDAEIELQPGAAVPERFAERVLRRRPVSG
ncbi:MAG TPA: hypothetical protein VGW40_01730 [Allosphingosinicella sp.]|nr:hypothetical protein [Allosphingosinicella sp.]